MLLERPDGFQVGSTVNAVTKGLWIWDTPIRGKTPEGQDIDTYIVDTEGLGSDDAIENSDLQLASLAILISTQFIFNLQNAIDKQKIDQLNVFIELGSHIEA